MQPRDSLPPLRAEHWSHFVRALHARPPSPALPPRSGGRETRDRSGHCVLRSSSLSAAEGHFRRPILAVSTDTWRCSQETPFPRSALSIGLISFAHSTRGPHPRPFPRGAGEGRLATGQATASCVLAP